MKVKKSDLKDVYELLEELSGFFTSSLDFIDDDQIEYVRNIGNKIDKSLKVIKNTIK